MVDAMEAGRVIVTGGSRGIGAAIVTALDAAGLDVVAVSRSGDAPAGRGVACDLTDEVMLKRVFAEIGNSGPVDGLVNNAGRHLGGKTSDLPIEDYEKVMALNATSVLLASREAYPYLKASRGLIINIGSFFDKLGVPNTVAYCASKAAVGAITRCLAVEWARDGIRVMNVAPGYIATDLNREFLSRSDIRKWLGERIATGGPGKPEDVATLVTSLITGSIPFLTGETIYIDGAQGMKL